MAKKLEDKLVEDIYLIDSKRCCLIVNKETGREFKRSLTPQDKWELVYFRSVKHPEEFECHYDKAITKGEELDRRYSKEELDTYSMPELRKIGKMFGVTGVSLNAIKTNIMEAQNQAVEA